MKSAPSISLINLNDPEERIVGSLERALTETGFVMVQGHGIPSELVRDVRRVVEGYFSRSAEEKMLDCITPDNYRGYIPLGFFSPNTGGNTPDHYEGYKLHHETSQEHPIRQQCDLYGPNKWPAKPKTCLRSLPNFGKLVMLPEDGY